MSGINETPTRLDIPKKRSSRNDPYLTPEKQTGVRIPSLSSPLNLSLDGNEPEPEVDAAQTGMAEKIAVAEPLPSEIPLPESPRVFRKEAVPMRPLTKVNPDTKYKPLTAEPSKTEPEEADELIRPTTADRPIPGGW